MNMRNFKSNLYLVFSTKMKQVFKDATPLIVNLSSLTQTNLKTLFATVAKQDNVFLVKLYFITTNPVNNISNRS